LGGEFIRFSVGIDITQVQKCFVPVPGIT
jgi:hypothetical protein